ncbi:rRNA maturation RNase YbeY [Alphaproteobacteria bacterium endosymbiont of Tiliacea citrago]|uniref:rRNA maturation RNase YbeY n=1 Tax=Alphaproteobacteria bacterium endosymbiont of Tiliacea citrago TaxID=3077944 RepID=UPI00313EEC0C
MFSIPNIPINYKIKVTGKISKIYQTLIKKIVQVTLYKEKNQNSNSIVEVVVCSEQEMKEYNKKYMNKDSVTDIISISYEETKDPILKNMIGIILICPKIIKEDSEELKKDYSKHLTHLIVHGTLHLLGYNHEQNEERNRMESKEVTILSSLGIESPYL